MGGGAAVGGDGGLAAGLEPQRVPRHQRAMVRVRGEVVLVVVGGAARAARGGVTALPAAVGVVRKPGEREQYE